MLDIKKIGLDHKIVILIVGLMVSTDTQLYMLTAAAADWAFSVVWQLIVTYNQSDIEPDYRL